MNDNPLTYTDPTGFSANGQPLCNSANFVAPSSSGGELSTEALNAGTAFTNIAGDGVRSRIVTLTWNALGKLRSLETLSGAGFNLIYGPDGGLVENTGPAGGRYLGPFLRQQDTNDWSARIMVRGRVIAVVKDVGGSVSTNYLIDNSLGSTAAVATGGGLIRRIAYGAWGQFVHPATGTGSVNPVTIGATTTVTYTGHELIAGAGLINMGARLYDPATGLFMSPDPTVAYPYNSQDLNQYAYMNGMR